MGDQTAFGAKHKHKTYLGAVRDAIFLYTEDALDSMIPDTEQFQYNYRSYASVLYLAALLGMLFYYFYTGYAQSANSYYLATLDSYTYSSNGGQTCEFIPVTISGNYYATIYGQVGGCCIDTFSDLVSSLLPTLLPSLLPTL
jgi:hypothetical protein